MKLQRKFFLVFLLISTIPVLIITLYTYSRYTRLITSQVEQSTENLMDAVSISTERTLQNMDHIVEAMYLPREEHLSVVDILKKYSSGSHPTPYQVYADTSQFSYVYQDFINFYSYINGIFLFTPCGQTLGYAYGNNINVRHDYDPSEDEWYQNTVALGGDTYIYGAEQKDLFEYSIASISFCTALYDVQTRDFLGVMMIDCSSEVFNLSSVNTMPDMATLTIMNQETPLYTTPASRIPKESEETLTLTRELGMDGLSIVASVQREPLYQAFRVTQIALISLAVICILVFIIISILLSRSLTKPIVTLGRQMSRPDGKHDVSDSPYFRYHNEIGTLYNAFQEMMDERNSYIKNELENKLILLDSQMKSLESQINAHFLYNTLEAINSIAAINHVPEISTMSMALGSMFRYSIKTKSELVPLSAELDHIHNYLSIQQIRFDNAIVYREEIPESFRQKRVLKLILQPLVENALYHGLNYCRSGNEITVSAQQENEKLLIFVTDNGTGMSSEQLNALNVQLSQKPEFQELGHRTEQSIGIKNIHTRISLYYGEYYGLQVFSEERKGTCIQITVPVIDEN